MGERAALHSEVHMHDPLLHPSRSRLPCALRDIRCDLWEGVPVHAYSIR